MKRFLPYIIVYCSLSASQATTHAQDIDPELIFRNFHQAQDADYPSMLVYPQSRYPLLAGLYPGSSGDLRDQIEALFGLNSDYQQNLQTLSDTIMSECKDYYDLSLTVAYTRGMQFRTEYLNELEELGFYLREMTSSKDSLSISARVSRDYLFKMDGLDLEIAEDNFLGKSGQGTVQFLQTLGEFRFFKDDNLTYLEIPTDDPDATIFMVYANQYFRTVSNSPEVWDFSQLLSAFDSDLLHQLRSAAAETLIEVKIPISHFSGSYDDLKMDADMDLCATYNHENVFPQSSFTSIEYTEFQTGSLRWDRIKLSSSSNFRGDTEIITGITGPVWNITFVPPSHRLIGEFSADRPYIFGIWNEKDQRVLALGQFSDLWPTHREPYKTLPDGQPEMTTSWQKSWMGWIYPVDARWIWNQDYGWLWVHAYSASGTFAWHQDNGWGWTQAESYPYVFFFNLGWWLPSGPVDAGN